MTPSDASRVIETLFSTSWPYCPVVYENLPTRDLGAAGQPSLFDETKPFITLEISHGFGAPVDVPLTCVRRFGSLVIMVLVPSDTGSRRVDEITDHLSSLLQYREYNDSSGQLRFKELSATSRNVLVNEWRRTTILVAFEYDQPVG